ncbi:TonB family protein, partial [candidate division WOR-3 bacterium]|nr:TonB family protein [candidate division WOR-3 bacterium]
LGVGGKKGMPFSITGTLSKRKILKKVLPPYPAGYEERTKVVVKITVKPGGNVKKLLLIKTGGEIFDHVTLEALREWKWEPLPSNTEQVDQEGTITFFYELK